MKTSLFGPGFPSASCFDLTGSGCGVQRRSHAVYSDSGLLISRCLKGRRRYWLLSQRDKSFNQKRIISGDCRSRSLLGNIALSRFSLSYRALAMEGLCVFSPSAVPLAAVSYRRGFRNAGKTGDINMAGIIQCESTFF